MRGLTAQEILSYHYPDHRSEDRSGQEVRVPMDGHGDADAHVKGVDDRYTPQPPLFRPKREDRDAHGKRNRRMRGRPTPEDSAAQNAESENVAQIGTHAVRGMDAARERLVNGSDKSANEFGLTDRPTGKTNSSASGKDSDRQQEERQDYGQESADMDGWKHPGTKIWSAGGKEVAPVEPRCDKNESKNYGNSVPDDPLAPEAAENVAGKRQKKLFHVLIVSTVAFEATQSCTGHSWGLVSHNGTSEQ